MVQPESSSGHEPATNQSNQATSLTDSSDQSTPVIEGTVTPIVGLLADNLQPDDTFFTPESAYTTFVVHTALHKLSRIDDVLYIRYTHG